MSSALDTATTLLITQLMLGEEVTNRTTGQDPDAEYARQGEVLQSYLSRLDDDEFERIFQLYSMPGPDVSLLY